jgi:ADP-ribose pyrophosphatase
VKSKLNGDERPTPPWSATVRASLLETPYFNVLLQDVRVTDGSARTYVTIDFPRPAVAIVPCRGDEILLVRQYRFIVDEYVWAIPSGSADAGESLGTAASRELFEETGYVADTVEPLLWCYASYGCSNQRFETFVARGLRLTGSFDPNEVMDTRWFTRQEVRELIGKNGVVDSLSLSPLLFVLLENVY